MEKRISRLEEEKEELGSKLNEERDDLERKISGLEEKDKELKEENEALRRKLLDVSKELKDHFREKERAVGQHSDLKEPSQLQQPAQTSDNVDDPMLDYLHLHGGWDDPGGL